MDSIGLLCMLLKILALIGAIEQCTATPTDDSKLRLPRNLEPTQYVVDLRPIFDPSGRSNARLIGSSTVTYLCKNATNKIILHSRRLRYTANQVRVKNENGRLIRVQRVEWDIAYQLVTVITINECSEGHQYSLSFENFTATLESESNGIYTEFYRTESKEKRVIIVSQMEPTGAREAFPCFDEPDFKATFSVTLWHKANTGYFAISNMPVESYRISMLDGVLWNSTTFETSVKMPTYLLAFVICDFSYVETFTKRGKVQARVYARKEAINNGEAAYASKITPRILDFYAEYFDIKYSLPKSDQIAVPGFTNIAMENWGLVIYSELAMLYKKSSSTVQDRLRVTRVIAHELAHQWFGNLVSPVWWDDIWLNEGFATYVSYLGIHELQPEWRVHDIFLLHELHRAYKVDGLTSSHPLVQSVNTVAEIRAQFDDISYGKGACVLRMINSFMGEGNFVAGLTSYLKEFSYDCSTHKDLFRNWENHASNLHLPTNLSTILETWTLQMGHPVVNIFKLRSPNNTFSVTQNYFRFDRTEPPVQTPGSLKYGYEWYIPFTYKRASQMGTDEVTMEWMQPHALSPLVIQEEDYILANIDAMGYYRVNYDETTWRKLATKLRSESFKDISVLNRAQLLDDAFAFVKTGAMDITLALDLTRYLVQEDDYVPWKAFFNNVKYLDNMLGRTPVYGLFSRYIREITSPSLYNPAVWKEKNRSDRAMVQRMMKQLGVYAACYYGNKECIKKAKNLYARWMRNPDNPQVISSSFSRDVYCTAIRHGGLEEWGFAWQQHLSNVNLQEKANLRYGMSCSKEPWILATYITYCLDPNYVNFAEALATCIQFIADSEYGRHIIWDVFNDQWESVLQSYFRGSMFSGSVIQALTNRFSTNHDLNQLKYFKETHRNLGSTKRAFNQAIEKTKVNIKWIKANGMKMKTWLENFLMESK